MRSRLGPINESASGVFSLLAKKISHHPGDERETAFFVSARFRASTAIQRRAATRFLCVWGLPGVYGHSDNFLLIFFQTPRDPWYRGYNNNNNYYYYRIFIAPFTAVTLEALAAGWMSVQWKPEWLQSFKSRGLGWTKLCYQHCTGLRWLRTKYSQMWCSK